MKKIKSSITLKLLASAVCLSLLPLLIMCFYISNHFYNSYFEKAIQNSTDLLESVSNNVDEKMKSLSMTCTMAITDKSLRALMEADQKDHYYQNRADRPDPKDTPDITQRYVTARQFFYSLEILNRDVCGTTLITGRDIYGNYIGSQIFDPAFPAAYQKMGWYREALALEGQLLFIDRHEPYATTGGYLQVISAVRSIFDAISHDYLGTIMVDTNVANLSNIIQKAKWKKGDCLLLLDSNNQIVCSDQIPADLEDRILQLRVPNGEDGCLPMTAANGSRYLVNYVSSNYTGWKLLHLIPEGIVAQESKSATLLIVGCVSVIILLMTVGTLYVLRSVSAPIVRLNERINRIGSGDLSDYPDPFAQRTDEIGQLSRSIVKMKDSLTTLIEKLSQMSTRQKEAQLKALQSQINPHFILNTLNSIQMMAKLGQLENVVFMLENLGRLFKNYIHMDKILVTIREEEQSIATYIALQTMRYGPRLRYTSSLPPEILQFQCLKFIVQPIVENAIVHGMEAKKSPTSVSLRGAYLDEAHILLTVEDDGTGMTEETLVSLRKKMQNSDHTAIDTEGSIGLQNVHNRLRLYYGDEYGIEIDSRPGRGTRVGITIPVVKNAENPSPRKLSPP